ncbi:MAG: peptidylprolyl isomerase [Pseudomonadota bacterium]
MIRRIALRVAALLLLFPLLAPPAMAAPGIVRVSMKTTAGTFVLAIDTKRAPITAKNFLAYVDKRFLDGTTFYRAARAVGNPGRGFIQGGVHRDFRRSLPPIAHEPTSKTGLRHVDGAISMARREPGSAMGEFFIMVGAAPAMDAKAGDPGYAVFGKVVSGMPVVRKILAEKTWPGGSGSMKGQLIKQPVKIVEAKRLS